MFRRGILVLALIGTLWAANVRLYLKDGAYHNVREYQKLADRVRYFSTERGEWEEIPLDLVDLKKTESEVKQRVEEAKERAKADDAEEKAERAMRREIERIPMNTGVFIVNGEKVTELKQAEVKAVTNKKRSILKAMSPIPIVAGKATVEIDGLKAVNSVAGERPEFYIRLNAEERFGIVRLTTAKASRIVETWNIVPISKEVVDEMDTVETFRQQIADGLYRIWPQKPLPSGEYAVVEYTEGKGNIQVWDFTLMSSAKPPEAPAAKEKR